MAVSERVPRWMGEIDARAGPRYIAIVEALAAAIESGELRSGDRIPTQRELARLLGLNPGTTARAYAIAAQRGLIAGETGRGTFVRREAQTPRMSQVARYLEPGEPGPENGAAGPEAMGDLALPNLPLSHARASLAAAYRRLSDDFLSDIGRYQPHGTQLPGRMRQTGQAWLRQLGMQSAVEDIVLTPGAQAALYIILYSANLRRLPVLTSAVTYSGLRNIAATHGRTLVPVAMDEHGYLPSAIDAACRRGQGRLLYLQTDLHNPLCITTPLERRREIVEVARKFDLVIIEDNAARSALDDAVPPVAALAPERTFLISSTGKSVAPALSLGVVATPPGWATQLNVSIRTHHVYPSMINAEVVRHVLAADATAAIWRETRAVIQRRAALARERLAPLHLRTHPESVFAWLELPESWTSTALSSVASVHGLSIGGSENFTVNDAEPDFNGARLSLTGTDSEDVFVDRLDRLSALLEPAHVAGARTTG